MRNQTYKKITGKLEDKHYNRYMSIKKQTRKKSKLETIIILSIIDFCILFVVYGMTNQLFSGTYSFEIHAVETAEAANNIPDPCGLEEVICDGEEMKPLVQLNEKDYIVSLIRKTFPEDADIMLAIANAESRMKPLAHNKNRNGTIDTGIFQINSIHGYDEKWLQDPVNNIKAAREVYDKQGLTAWATYNYAVSHNRPVMPGN